ncbi:hypothetical protein Tco_0237943 [Tanacetum coccineum]
MADLLLEEKLSQALHALCEKLNKNVQEKQEEKNVAEEQSAKLVFIHSYCFIDNTSRVLRFGINKWYQSLALRNFNLEDMELESINSCHTAKLPTLKLGEYEIWVIRIKQYFQIQDYALWEYPDAKSMFAAIKTRFRGNAAIKKTQKTLLKQQYENFSATSSEVLDSIFNRLSEDNSRLAIWGFGHFAKRLHSTKKQVNVVQENTDNTRKQGNNEDTSLKAMLAIDGVGFDWSDVTPPKWVATEYGLGNVTS